jgi:hypothetical protein
MTDFCVEGNNKNAMGHPAATAVAQRQHADILLPSCRLRASCGRHYDPDGPQPGYQTVRGSSGAR